MKQLSLLRITVTWLIGAGCATLTCTHAQNFTFVTLAGDAGYGNADGVGGNARFRAPAGVAANRAGTVYIADTWNHTIRKMSPDGVVVTLAGVVGQSGFDDGIGSAARFAHPNGVAVDESGIVYVADTDNHTIRTITPEGLVTTLAGSAGNPGSTDGLGKEARFYHPSGVATDGSGNLYVADTDNRTIRKLTFAAVVTTFAGAAGAEGSADGTGGLARFRYPAGVGLDGSGNVYVADLLTIRKIAPSGEVTTLAGRAGAIGSEDGSGSDARFHYPANIAVAGSGDLYVADSHNNAIRKITPSGEVTTLAGLAEHGFGSADGVGSAARFHEPYGITMDGSGNIFVADTGNHTVRKVTLAGAVTTIAGLAGGVGTTDGTGSAARFHSPDGIAVDATGSVYVSDSANNTVRKITTDGMVMTLAGLAGLMTGGADGVGSAARFLEPRGMAVDATGNVYVADCGNHTIRKMTPAGVVTTLAGVAGSLGSADGSGMGARFRVPHGVALDSSGNVYVADSGNHAIRKVTPTGTVSTLAGNPAAVDPIYGTPRPGYRNGVGQNAQFSNPLSVASDQANNLFVADTDNHVIRKILPEGIVTTWAGQPGNPGSNDGTRMEARFYKPSGLSVDGSGNLFVADYYNFTIRRISSDGVVTTVGGLPGRSGRDDGSGNLARFFYPSALALDMQGNLYVTDSSNHIIRKAMPAGPALEITRVGNTILLSWPISDEAFALEYSNGLEGTSWAPLVSTTGIVGNKILVIEAAEGPERFYRLEKK